MPGPPGAPQRPPLAPAVRVGAAVLLAALGLAAGTLAAGGGSQKLVLAGAAALVYAALFVWQPELAILGYIALRPLVDAFVFQGVGGFSLGELWGFGLIASACLFLIVQARDREEPLKLSLVPLAFLFFLAALTFFRPEIKVAVAAWTKVASWVLVLMVCERISRDRRGQRRCFNAAAVMVLTLLLAVGIMVAQGRFGAAFYSVPIRRVSGQLPHPLSVGAVLLLPFTLTALLFVRPRLLALAGAVGLCVAVVASFVRTAYVGAVIVLVSLVAAGAWAGTKARLVALLVLGAALAIGWTVRGSIATRFSDLESLSSSGTAFGSAGSGRVDIWTAAWRTAFDSVPHALTGRGPAGAATAMRAAAGFNVGAQNDFLDFVLTGGLVLGVCYLVLLVWMALAPVALLRDPGQSAPAKTFAALTLGTVAAFAVMSMINGIATYQPIIAVGLLVGLARGMALTPGDTFLDDPAPGPDTG